VSYFIAAKSCFCTSSPLPTEFDRAYVMCLDQGDYFGFQAVNLADLPMQLKDDHQILTDTLRKEEFSHQFPNEPEMHQYKLFAVCEKGRFNIIQHLSLPITG